jgi:hypothetical protein
MFYNISNWIGQYSLKLLPFMMYEERVGKCLQQVEHIRGHLWQIFHNGQPNHGCNRKTFDVICNLSKEVLDLFNFIYFFKILGTSTINDV